MIRWHSFILFSLLPWLLNSCGDPSRNETGTHQPDSLSYEVITLTKRYKNCISDSVECTRILLSFPRFTKVNAPLADSLAFWQNEAIGNKDAKITDPNLVMEFFLRQYEEVQVKDLGSSIPWNLEKRLSVLNQNPKWVCLELSCFGYEGGAHDNGIVQYITLEKATGRRLVLADFFDSTNLSKLTQLGEKYFCEAREIRPEQSLDEAGFQFPESGFYLPENFYFNKAGLTFCFNAYEVGPYVMGETEFTIPANKLVMLMRKNE